MDDSALTRLAVQEILHNINDEKDQQERKINPLGKPNKRFLGRTLNSMLTHNKREDKRTQVNCRRKLIELEKKHRQRLRREHFNRSGRKKTERTRSRSESSHEIFSSDSSSEDKISREKMKKSKWKKKKRSRNPARSRSRSNSSSSSSGSRSRGGKARNSNYKRMDRYEAYYDLEECDDIGNSEYYMKSQEYYGFGMAAAAFNHINQFWEYQTMHPNIANQGPKTELAQWEDDIATNDLNDIKQCIEKTESISLSSHSLSLSSSSFSVSTHSEDEVDAQGVLTINVSSEENSWKDEDVILRKSQWPKKLQKKKMRHCFPDSTSICSSSASAGKDDIPVDWASCISLGSSDESEKDENNERAIKVIKDFVAITSSSEEEEIVRTIGKEKGEIVLKKQKQLSTEGEKPITKIPQEDNMVDLTED